MQVRAPVTHESLRTVVPACTAVPDSEEVAEVAQKKLGEEEGERSRKCRGDKGSVPLKEGSEADEQVSRHHMMHLAQRLPEEDTCTMASASLLSTSQSSTSSSLLPSSTPDSCRALRKEEEFVSSQDTAVVIEVPPHGTSFSSAKRPTCTGGFSLSILTVKPAPDLLAPPTHSVSENNAELATSSAQPPTASPQLISAPAARTQAQVPAETCNKTNNPAHAHLKGATNPRTISLPLPGTGVAGKREGTEGDGKPPPSAKPPPSPKRRLLPREPLSPSTTPREPRSLAWRSPSPTLRGHPAPQIHKLAAAARGTAIASLGNDAQNSVVVDVARSPLQV